MRAKLFLFLLLVLTAAFSASRGSVATTSQHFYREDPHTREPESQDASRAAQSEIGDLYEMLHNLFVTPKYKPSGVRAENLNTIDEVPDSSWFINRIGARTLTIDEVVRGPIAGAPPDPSRWVILREKLSGMHPGITARDAKGETWFLEFDPPYYPEAATGAVVMATKYFWALGYNQVESFLTTFDPKRMEFDPEATLRRPSGKRTPFTRDDINSILENVAHRPDGTYRVVAGRLLPEDPRQLPLRGHPTRRSQRCRAARAAARVARATCVRRLDESDRPQVEEHDRYARDRERPFDREALASGRRIDVWHVQRPV